MEETFNIKALVLNRKPFFEDGSRVTVYSENLGKFELVARGTKKIKSKLAGHLEPISLAEIMVVQGKQYNYIGAAISEDCYANIKNNFAKVKAAGEAVKIFNLIIKFGESDRDAFLLLKDYFCFLDGAGGKLEYDLFVQLFIFKLLIKLGHKPELYNCVNCQAKITPVGIKFDPARGGLVCGKCLTGPGEKTRLIISENSVKFLRLAEKNNFSKINKIKINKKAEVEIKNIISSFLNYIF